MNVAACNVVAMNIPHSIECSSHDSAMLDILFCQFRTWSLTLFTNSAASLPMTKFQNKPVLGDALTQVSPFYRESALRTLQNAHSCREEIPHDEGQLFAMYPKKHPQVSPIDRALQLHFSTLEKTNIDHNPLVYYLVLTVPQVSPFYRHLEQIFQDLDIRTRSSPGFDEAEEDTNEGILAVKFIMGRDLAVTRSSPDPCRARFAIAAMQAVELKWLILNKVNK